MKIDLITMHRVFNYGSVLQTYATVTYLKNMGNDVEVIDYIPKRFRDKEVFTYVNPRRNKSIFHKIVFIIVSFPGRLLHKILFTNFIKRSYKLTSKSYYSEEDLKKDLPQADVYITGSDQVWNSGFENKVDRNFFLDFVPENKKRIAYAASFGKSKLDKYEIEEVKELISKYDKISVREDSAIEILKNLGRRDAEHVIDPTLLLSKEEWEKKMGKHLTKEKYVLIYQLNPNEKIIEYARKIADKKNIKVAKFGWDYLRPKGVDINFAYKRPEEFLSAIKYAEFIVTDSFHGTIFSLIFNKMFICVAPPKYSTRLESILNEVELNDRLIKGEIEITKILRPIDYKKINKHFIKAREKAKEYLEKAINN